MVVLGDGERAKPARPPKVRGSRAPGQIEGRLRPPQGVFTRLTQLEVTPHGLRGGLAMQSPGAPERFALVRARFVRLVCLVELNPPRDTLHVVRRPGIVREVLRGGGSPDAVVRVVVDFQFPLRASEQRRLGL